VVGQEEEAVHRVTKGLMVQIARYPVLKVTKALLVLIAR
jgi:hypothetical protein